MIKLYSKDYVTEYGAINTLTDAFVEEERNGLFELSFIMLNTDSLFSHIEKENIVVANANDVLLNQKFRIYNIRKLMNNRVEVYARHISFDLMYDYIDNFQCTNQSCQYVLNQLFIKSNFSNSYKGYSDIVNAQNYDISNSNILSAIGGTSGSILDTFGTGAELLRDNEKISVLNRRGNDNLVTIEYKKNLTGFELEEDTSELVTRILPYAKYNPTDSEGNQLEEVTLKANYVDSPLINNYSHPYIKSIDYSDKFEDEEVPTLEKLIAYAQREYNINKVDIPKQNFKIDFIPLSKCVGYDELNDKISLCDTVTIIDTRYNINTKAKVIKTKFNVLKNRYESIELGEPRTSLGDIIGEGGSNEPVVGPPGPAGPAGQDGNLGDFPDSLPQVPILESFVYGFSNIELTWSFESKIYYQYELYASKTKDFTPNSFDLIFQGQASSYMFQAQPSETWYFKVCGVNTYGKRTAFSNQATVTTTKITDLSNYVSNMAIGDALIGNLNLGRAWVGQLNANLLNVKGNFSVTNGNGVRTFDIDSFGNVHINGYATFSDLGDYVSESDLGASGTTVINGNRIQTGTLNVDRLNSNNANPIIRLFGNCALDATSQNNQGQGDSIRLKWDDYNYFIVNKYKQAGCYLNGRLAFQVNAGYDFYNKFLITPTWEGHYRAGFDGLHHFKWLSSGSMIQVRNGSDSGYGDIKAYTVNYYNLYAGSDYKLKENIEYIQESSPNARTFSINEAITEAELFDFVKNLRLSTYNYKESTNENIGFILNDYVGTKIGDKITIMDDEGYLNYNVNSYINVIAGALKEEIRQRESLENRVAELERQIQNIIGGVANA